MTATAYDNTSTASVMYLTGVSTDDSRESERDDVGLLVTPRSSIHRQLEHYALFGADNGCYKELHPTDGFTFDADAWLRWVAGLPREGCLFVTLPDVLRWYEDPQSGDCFPIGDLEATIARSARYVEAVRALGFPVAVVAQDGLGSLDELPFDVDAVFIGGSDDYKLGPMAAALAAEARERGKWVHVGRVNSYKRLAHCQTVIGADSADGTFLRFGRKGENWPRLTAMLDKVAELARPIIGGAR